MKALQVWLTQFCYKDLDDVAAELRKRCDEINKLHADRNTLVLALKHLIHSNHGFQPDSCHGCGQVQRLVGERL